MTGYTMLRIAVKDRAWTTLKKNWVTAVVCSAIYTACIALLSFFVKLGVQYFLPHDRTSAIGAGALFGIFAVAASAPMLAGIFEIFNKLLNGAQVKVTDIFSWYTDRTKLGRAAALSMIMLGAVLVVLIISLACLGICYWFVHWLFADFNMKVFDVFAALAGSAAGIAAFVQLMIWLNAAVPVFYSVSKDTDKSPFRCLCTVFVQTIKYSKKFLILTASFVLWYVAAAVSMGLLVPFVFPYLIMSYILFYKACVNLDGQAPRLSAYAKQMNKEREEKIAAKKEKKKKKPKKKKSDDDDEDSEEEE